VLIVTSGTGWVQERGKEKQIMQARDVVWGDLMTDAEHAP
jgi:quercetin dioxygenase-like cupin family protein